MFCWWFKKLISDRLDGRLSGRKEKRLSRHLESCAACRAYLRSLEIIQSGSGLSMPPQVPENYWPESIALFKHKLMEERSRELLAKKNRKIGAQRWRLGWALIGAGLAVIAIYMFLPRPKPSPPEVFATAEILPSLMDQVEDDASLLDAFNEAIEAEIRELTYPEDSYITYIENHALLLEELSDEEIELFLLEIQKEEVGEGW